MKLRSWNKAFLPLIAAASIAYAEVAPPDPLFVETVELLQSDAGAGDLFGQAVAVDGDVMVVSGDDFGVGGAYVFERNHGGPNRWGEIIKLTAPGGVPGDDFGKWVAVEEDTIAAGAYVADPASSGAVYLYGRDHGGPGAWGLFKKLLAPDGPQRGQGFFVPALSGDTLIVGTDGDSETGTRRGAVFVYERDVGGPNNWEFVQKLMASDGGNEDRFGNFVAIDGDTIVGGNHQEEAYVFERDGSGVWSEVTKLTASDGGPSEWFGRAVSIEGDLVVVGARRHDVAVANSGAVYVYQRDFGGVDNWGEVAKLVHDEAELGDALGTSVAIDGGRIFAGAIGVDRGEVESPGAAFLFQQDRSGEWVQLAKVIASDGDHLDFLGESVDLSGGTLVAGSHTHDVHGFNAGSAYVFQAVAAPELTVSGVCPGEITLSLTGATRTGVVSVAHAASEGTGIIPGGRCEGTELGLTDSRLLSSFVVDLNGAKTIRRHVPVRMCGSVLQVVDMTTCSVGNVLQVSP